MPGEQIHIPSFENNNPQFVWKRWMDALIDAEAAETYHQAHQILIAALKAGALSEGSKPLTEEERTRLEESQRRLVMGRRFMIDHME